MCPPPNTPRIGAHDDAGAGAPLQLDPRLHVYRDDLAAAELKGRVRSQRFVVGEARQVVQSALPLRGIPDSKASYATELIFGERVMVYETREGWAWVQSQRDRYVGYVPTAALSRTVVAPTHKVRALGTFLYPAPDIKTAPLMHLSIGSELAIAETGESFSRLIKGGYVVNRHIVEIDRHHRDYVEIAERFIGTPYLWGGRTRLGIDCSGLVQVSLEAAGFAAPRDSDMQQSALGEPIAVPSDLEGLRRGDLVFWKGHVGLMVDGLMLVHANAHHMAVAVETLPEAVGRIARSGSSIVTIRRMPALAAPMPPTV